MNRRDFLTTSGIALLTSVGCVDKEHLRRIAQELYEENKKREAEAINNIIDSIVFLTTVTEYRVPRLSTATVTGIGRGIGIAYGNYVLTVDHVVSLYTAQQRTDKGQTVQVPIEKIKETTMTLNGVTLERIVNNKIYDIAVFKLPLKYSGARYPFELGDSDRIGYGQEIFVIGSPNPLGLKFRKGEIGSKVFISANNRVGFYLSSIIPPRHSGLAVVDKNTFSLLGLTGESAGYAFVIPINMYKPYLK